MAVSPPALRPRHLPAERVDVADRDASPRTGAAERTHLAPLLAVCGLCGGAGVSTLSYLLARFAVRELAGHVLVCDSGGPTGGLAGCTGVESSRSLSESADQIARGLPLAGGLYAVDGHASRHGRELRVIATGPRLTEGGEAGGLQALLGFARGASTHSLVVVDCGTLQLAADRLALRAASHIAWVLPATRGCLRRAERVLAAATSEATGRELIVARRQPHERAARLKSLKELAEWRQAPLVLMPNLGEPGEDPVRALRESQLSLQAICAVLQR